MSQDVRQLACQSHPEADLIEDYRAGDIICSVCALVVGDRMIDVGSEWRTFSNDSDSKDMSRVGAAENSLYDGNHLETVISSGTGAGALDEHGNQRYNNGPRQVSSADRALRNGRDTIRQMAGRISLASRVIDTAYSLFKRCYETKCVRGRPQDAVVAACIYIACRKEDAQRSIKEICAIATTASKTDIGRCYKQIIRSLPDFSRSESIATKNLIPRFCKRLELRQINLIQKTAVHIAERAKELCNIQSRAPDSIASASIYMACAAAGERKPITDIQVAAGVMENTIRQIYKIMLAKAAELFPSNFEFKCSPENLPTS
jgi:transcription initiation factor TFIIB